MASVTIRNLPDKLVKSLKRTAARHGRSMEQELRRIIEMYVGDKAAAMKQVEQSWSRQSRRPTAEEVDSWIDEGRP
jgi:plasmid stability protein